MHIKRADGTIEYGKGWHPLDRCAQHVVNARAQALGVISTLVEGAKQARSGGRADVAAMLDMAAASVGHVVDGISGVEHLAKSASWDANGSPV